jgi:hypothetical protein
MLTIKQLNVKIAGVKKSSTSIRNNVQEILCSTAGHAFEHGDVTMFAKLFDASKGLNRKKIVKWVHENGFARLQADGTFKVNKTMRKEADFVDGEAVAKYLSTETPAWFEEEESAQAILKALDVTSRITSLVKQIDKAVETGQEIKQEDVQVALRILESKVESIAA